MTNQDLTIEQKIANVKQSYLTIKEFIAAVTDAINGISNAADYSDADLRQAINNDVLAEIVAINLHALNMLDYLKADYLDNGLRTLSVVDPSLNDNGLMSSEEQNKLGLKIYAERLEKVRSYVGQFSLTQVEQGSSAEFKAQIATLLRSFNIEQLRELCSITVELFIMLKTITTITIEDFLIQCKTEMGIEFEKL